MTTTTSSNPDRAELMGEKTLLFGMSNIFYLRILSIIGVFIAWEIAGLVPISIAFPTFSETMQALYEMIADGRLISAFAETLKPLGVGVVISTVFGVLIGVSMGLNRPSQWTFEPIFVCFRLRPSQHSFHSLPTPTASA